METLSQPHTQESSEKTNTNNLDYSREEIEGTPFTIIKREEEYLLVIGNNLIDRTKEKETLIQRIEKRDWLYIGALANIITNHEIELSKNNKPHPNF